LRRLSIAFGVLIALTIVGALVAPSFVDWNAMRADLGRQISAALGVETSIDGDITASLLPSPRFSIGDARLVAAPARPGETEGEGMRIGRVEVRVALAPLLSGLIRVERVALIDPKLNWTIDERGETAWASALGRLSSPPESLNFENVEIRGARLVRRDRRSGSVHQLEMIEGRVAADSPLGPYHVNGRFSADGVEFQGDLVTGRLTGGVAAPLRLNLSQPGGDATLRLAGIVTTDAAGGRRFSGEARAEGGNLAAAALPILSAIDENALPPKAFDRPFSLKTSVEATAARLVFDDIDAKLGDGVASGTLAVDLDGETPAARAILAVNRIDLDVWNAGGPLHLPAPPRNFSGGLELSVDALSKRGGAARQLRFDARLNDGVVTVDRLSALLPGGADLAASGTVDEADDGRARVDARVEVNADNLRSTLDWLGVDTSAVPADRLRRVSLSASVLATADRVEATGIDARLDTARLTGGVTVARGPRPAIGARIEADRINLDAYAPDPALLIDRARAAFAKIDLGLKMTAKEASLAGTSVKDARLDLIATGGAVDIRELSAADLAGSRVRLTGRPPMNGDASFDLTLEADGSSLQPLARLVPISLVRVPPVDALGAYSGRLRVVGTSTRVEFETRLDAAGGSLAAGGAVDNPLLPAPGYDLRVRVTHPDTAALARKLTGARFVAGALGPSDLYARVENGPRLSDIRGTLAGTAVAGALAWTRTGETPTITGELRLGDLDIDRLRRAPEGARGIEPALLAANALAGAGGEVAVSAQSVTVAGLRADDVAGRIRLGGDGVHVEDVRAAMFGGRIGGSLRFRGGERPEMTVFAETSGVRPTTTTLPGGVSVRSAAIDLEATIRLVPGSSGAAKLVDGEGWFALRDGALEGVEPSALAADPQARVAFSSAGGRFHVENGVPTSDDLNLVWPQGVARAKGSLDLTADTIDLSVRVDHRDGQGTPPTAFRITGPTSGPRRFADSRPQQAATGGGASGDVIRGLLENLKR